MMLDSTRRKPTPVGATSRSNQCPRGFFTATWRFGGRHCFGADFVDSKRKAVCVQCVGHPRPPKAKCRHRSRHFPPPPPFIESGSASRPAGASHWAAGIFIQPPVSIQNVAWGRRRCPWVMEASCWPPPDRRLPDTFSYVLLCTVFCFRPSEIGVNFASRQTIAQTRSRSGAP